MFCQCNTSLKLPHHLIRTHDQMPLGNGKLSHSGQTMHLAGILVAEQRRGLTITDWQVPIGMLGILITVMIELFKEPILLLFGADELSLRPAIEYIRVYALGTVCVQIAQGMNPYINTQGFAKMGMATILIGAILNIVLDPVFIFGLGMGITGAAVATVISQGVSAIWVLYFLLRKSPVRLRAKYLPPKISTLGSIMMLGISPFVMSATEGLLQISFNNQMSVYGGNMAVGTMAILMSLYQMVWLPLGGIAQGAQPILSYNYGAKNYGRVREAFRLAFKVCLIYSIVSSGIIMWFSPIFARIFSGDGNTIRYASWAIRIYMFGALIFGAQIACQQSFMALGQAKRSLCMALLRKVFLLIPLIYIVPCCWENPVWHRQWRIRLWIW